MSQETAIWYPYWYELDQPIAVSEVADFDFFEEPPSYVAHEGRRVFYHGLWQPQLQLNLERRRMRVLSIRHPELGSIQSINTKGLDYTLIMSDGRVLKVEAEETPGLVYEHQQKIADWRILVELEPV